MNNNNTVVYLDDDKDDRELLQDAFTDLHNHRLVCVSEAAGLFAYLSQHIDKVCLIVLDINLPIVDGIEVLKQIKSYPLYTSLPIVMFTTGTNSPQTKELKEMNVEVIEKPDNYKEMMNIVAHLSQYCLHSVAK